MSSWKRLRAPCLMGAFSLLMLGASTASADIGSPFTSTLNFGNSGLNGTTGPYGSVVVNLTSNTTASIVFTADNGYLFTDGSSVDANGNFTYTSASGNCSSCSYSSGGLNQQVDGIGTFAAIVDSGNSSPSARSSTITLDVTANSGTNWADASQVLMFNSLGYDAGAHIYVNSTSTGGTAGQTGYAGESAVPEPTTIILLGSSMIGVGAIVRRRRNSRLAQS